MWRKAFLPWILAVGLVAASLGALQTALRLQHSLETYRSPYGAKSEPAASSLRLPLVPLARRVVLVVVDGLRDDTSHRLPFLESLRRQGAWTELRTRIPSYSKPNYAVLLTGTWAEINGVALNAHSGRVATDHLLHRLREAGLRSAVIGDEWWGELADGEVDYPYLYPDAETHSPEFDSRVAADALRSLRTDPAAFTLVHLCAVDTAGHATGAQGRDYLRAARASDDRLRELAQEIDFTQDVLIVTADHGHLWQATGGGGHGGGEPEVVTVPLVMVGHGIRPGRLEPGEPVDTAPTVAALLGAAPPREARGRPRWEAMTVDEPARAAWSASQLAGSVEFAKSYLGALENRPAGQVDQAIQTSAKAVDETDRLFAAGRFGEAAALSEKARRDLFQDLDGRRAWRVILERVSRVPQGFLLGLAIPALLVLALPRRAVVGLFLGAVFLALDALVYGALLRHPWSFSALPGSGVTDFLALFGLPAYLALLLPLVPFIVTARRRSPAESLGGGLGLMAGCYSALALVVAVGGVVNGLSIGRFLPEFPLGYVQLMALLQLGFLLPAAVAVPLGLSWLSRRPSTPEPVAGAGPADSGATPLTK